VPSSAENLWKQLNLEGSVHDQDWDSLAEARLDPGHQIGKPEILFKKVEDKDIDKEKNN
jgi:methionyl-tRNA synthetase